MKIMKKYHNKKWSSFVHNGNESISNDSRTADANYYETFDDAMKQLNNMKHYYIDTSKFILLKVDNF